MSADSISLPEVTVAEIQAAEAAANPFLSGLANLGGSIFNTASGLISKATEVALDTGAQKLAGAVIGSTAPTGSTSPEAAAQAAKTTVTGGTVATVPSGATANWEKYAIPAAAVLGALVVFAMIMRNRE